MRWCSTPFGIKDHFTHFQAQEIERGWECSTPFGIKDHFTSIRLR
jgi:hypothetical protein